MTAIEDIEKLGYCKLEQIYSAEEVEKTLALVQEWEKSSPEDLDNDYVPRLNKNNPNVYNLQSKDKYFLDILFKSAELEQILIHFLNDKYYKQIPGDKPNYILRHMGARSSQVALPLHIDSFIPYTGGPVISMQVAIFLEDSTWENGHTLVIPKSHKSGNYAEDSAREFCTALDAKKGDLLIWDSRLWHGTSTNFTDQTSWRIVATFTRWWIKPMFDITRDMPRYIREQLTPKQKSIMGFNSIPYLNEFAGIDMKRGYE